MLRRLRLPLPVTENTCRCHRRLDPLCDHRAACSTSGVLRSREVGARVTSNTRLADLNLAVDRLDDRRLEVVANGLPPWGGAQLAVDTTLVSPLDSAGRPRRRGGRTRGAALVEARLRKERAYPELLRAYRCGLVVLALEVGGQWSEEAASFVRLLARAWAREVPLRFRSATAAAFIARSSAFLSFAAKLSFAESLLEGRVSAGRSGFGGAAASSSYFTAWADAKRCLKNDAVGDQATRGMNSSSWFGREVF